MFTIADGESFARLGIAAEPLHGPPAPAAARPGLQLTRCDRGHPLRESAEAFVRRAYQRAHAARIATFFDRA